LDRQGFLAIANYVNTFSCGGHIPYRFEVCS